jgi:hypothetical protein
MRLSGLDGKKGQKFRISETGGIVRQQPTPSVYMIGYILAS